MTDFQKELIEQLKTKYEAEGQTFIKQYEITQAGTTYLMALFKLPNGTLKEYQVTLQK